MLASSLSHPDNTVFQIRFEWNVFRMTKESMSFPTQAQITDLLIAWGDGDQAALERLSRWSMTSCAEWRPSIFAENALITRSNLRHW